MQVQRFDNADLFYERVTPFLLTDEARNNLIFGILNAIRRGRYTDDLYLASIEHDTKTQMVALRTPPHNLLLSTTTETEALKALATDVFDRYGEIPGVHGPVNLVRAFVDIWQARTNQIPVLEMGQRTFQLTQVRPPTGVPGIMRLIDERDRIMLYDWHYHAMIDMFDGGSRDESRTVIDNYLHNSTETRCLFLWEVDNTPVSMTGLGGETPNGVRIGSVYTPPTYRQNGYASALVAAVSQHALDSGRRYCFLFTDLANPTSNHIYQAIGYEPVEDFEMYRLQSQ